MLTNKIVVLATAVITAVSLHRASAEYIEGIDTTDTFGYGLNSAFQVTSGGKVLSESHLCYGLIRGESGPLNYSFDDIKYAAASEYLSDSEIPLEHIIYTCFVVKKGDSTYSKVQILETLPDNRTVFRFGSNTEPFDRMLERPDYDRSVRYKPNNVTHHFHYYCDGDPRGDPGDTLYWEPPLPNDNHLLGYVLYQSRERCWDVDTTRHVESIEWDSVAFTDTCQLVNMLDNNVFVNIAAVYAEGKSELIQGWTMFASTAVGISGSPAGHGRHEKTITCIKSCTIALPPEYKGAMLSINSISGRRLAVFPFSGRPVSLNGIHRNIPSGRYLIRAEFSDRADITQPFTISR